MFVDTKQSKSCAGFRRIGEPRRGGYDWIMGGILSAAKDLIAARNRHEFPSTTLRADLRCAQDDGVRTRFHKGVA